MRKFTFYIFILFFVLQAKVFKVIAQDSSSPVKALTEERENFLDRFTHISRDSVLIRRLSRAFELQVDSIYTFIKSGALLTDPEKEKAIRSLGYFIKELDKGVAQQKIEMYNVVDALRSYKSLLKAVLSHNSFAEVMKPLGPFRSQLMPMAFMQYSEYPFLDELAVYKRMASSPEFILDFLQSKPGFRYTDSLLVRAAAYDPIKFSRYQGKSPLGDLIHKTKNIYIQQILSLSGERNAPELLPFVIQIAEDRITPDSVLATRMDVNRYFQLMVTSLLESPKSNDSSSIFLHLLRNGIKQKSLSFYTNDINELHSSADAVRFASVKTLRPEDIYYIITSSADELYTSSYLGLYKRLMEFFKPMSADSLFSIVGYDNFRVFMRLAANYNVLGDFLTRMPVEKSADLLKRFITGIEIDTQNGVEKAMDVADSFTGLGTASDITEMIQRELQSNLNRCQNSQLYFGEQLYGILLQVFGLVKQTDNLNKLWTTLGNYEKLPRTSLLNKYGDITELVLFYGDEDGIASYSNFLKMYNDASKWKIEKNELWTTIRSISDEPVVIYANLPLDEKEELDIKAQDSLVSFLREQSTEPTVLVHRGHSYHLNKTLKWLTPSIKLAILGSCGGYNNVISIASINPDVQIIGSKKTGAKTINDPVIQVINETLMNKSDLYWSEIWDKLSTRFSKDEFSSNLFNEYIPPAKNVSLFVLKLFNYYNRPAGSQPVALEHSR